MVKRREIIRAFQVSVSVKYYFVSIDSELNMKEREYTRGRK